MHYTTYILYSKLLFGLKRYNFNIEGKANIFCYRIFPANKKIIPNFHQVYILGEYDQG